MKLKRILTISIIIIISCSLLSIKSVNAAIQSNGDSPTTKNRNTWMSQIRQMEGTGGGFGLDESINANLTSAGDSNNIDVHMQKNTEYGAMVLLSASSYGKPTKIENGETTTGNETGVVMPYNIEWVAAQHTDWLGTTEYDNRYINYYQYSADYSNQKRGDAYLETRGWHGSSWLYQKPNEFVDGAYEYDVYRQPGAIIRVNNSIFGFNNRGQMEGVIEYASWGQAYYKNVAGPSGLSQTYTSRLVVVNGQGL